jgi:hypothetical protein
MLKSLQHELAAHARREEPIAMSSLFKSASMRSGLLRLLAGEPDLLRVLILPLVSIDNAGFPGRLWESLDHMAVWGI